MDALHVSRLVRRLTWSNLTSSASVLGADGPIVCLTSYGERLQTAFLTIESIARGTLLPSRLILWLDQKDVFLNQPKELLHLQRRGLEVRLTNNYGPHTKYYPYVESTEAFHLPLVTADDDILYPKYWLQQLAEAYDERPDLINCYRARVIALDNEKLANYEKWRMCNSTEATIRHFATGVSGVIYPPGFLSFLKHTGTRFEDCCPKADDIWLHVQALRAGYKVRQFVKKFRHFPMIPDTQHLALQISNWGEQDSGNDRQAAMTYTAQDLEMLRRSFADANAGPSK